MVVNYDEYGLYYNDNLALSLVYGVDNHQSILHMDDGYVKFGKTYGIVRDYTVFVSIFLPHLFLYSQMYQWLRFYCIF